MTYKYPITSVDEFVTQERRSKRAAADQKGNQSHRKSKEYPSTSKSNTQKPRPDDFKLERKKRNSIPNLQGYDHFRTSSVSLEPPTPQYRRSPDASTVNRLIYCMGPGHIAQQVLWHHCCYNELVMGLCVVNESDTIFFFLVMVALFSIKKQVSMS